ncbi:amino acid racemase [Candidatus Woesearchaeota archaeon]|nr:amino acid racemase [Candidatus Woesearchaeota archaeon]
MTAENTNPRAGIIGGMGPQTSSQFCLNINMKFRQLANRQPDMVIENVPISLEDETELINGGNPKNFRALLTGAVRKLNHAHSDFIAVPCNTAHFFLEDLRKISSAPIISIIDECALECSSRNIKIAGLLATPKTIKERLFEAPMKEAGVDIILPSEADQKMITNIIFGLISNRARKKDSTGILKIIRRLRDNGAEAVVIGCTDISLLISDKNSAIPVIETVRILEDSVIKMLLHGKMPK